MVEEKKHKNNHNEREMKIPAEHKTVLCSEQKARRIFFLSSRRSPSSWFFAPSKWL
jgi:hypothetical protein